MRTLMATGSIVVAAAISVQAQEPAISVVPRYVEVPVLELKGTADTPSWRLFAMKTSPTTVTWAIFRDDAEAVPAMRLALNATPPFPVEMVWPALFELSASELADVLRRDTLHALLISVGDREQSLKLTHAQRLALLGIVNSEPAQSYAEDTIADCRLKPPPTDDWVVTAGAQLYRRFKMAFDAGLRPQTLAGALARLSARRSYAGIPGRVVVRTAFTKAGVPAAFSFVPSRTGDFNIIALRAIAGARVAPPPEPNEGILEVCVELNPTGPLPDVGNRSNAPQDSPR